MNKKTVLITGCSSGIGFETAKMLKQKNWHVFATARKPEDIAMLKSLGLDACQLEVRDSASIKSTVDYVLRKTGNSLYGLVNNAGFGLTSAAEDLNRQILRDQFEVNVFGLWELINLLMPFFRKQGCARIVNISSIAGKFAVPFMGAYSASKFALEALSDALRMELYNTNIKVSLIEPGIVESDFSNNALKVLQSIKDKDKSSHSHVYEIIQQRRMNRNTQKYKYTSKDVALKITHALESKNPKIRYLITPKARLLYYAKRMLPDSFFDFLVSLNLAQYNKKDQ